MVGSIQALNPLRLIPADRKFPINRLTILFGLAIAGLALYTIYSLRNRATPKATNPFEEGNQAFAYKHFTVAISKYTAALEQAIDPNEQTTIFIHRNRAFFKLNQFDQVVASCQAALSKDLGANNIVLLLLQMGLAYDMLEKLPEALTVYERTIECDQKKEHIIPTKIFISHVQRKQRQYEASLTSCNDALLLSKKPEDISHLHYSKSSTLLDQGNLAEAEEENRIALDHAPHSNIDLRAEILILQACILNRKRQPQQALEAGNQALELSPDANLEIEIHLARALSHYNFNKSLPLDDSLQNYDDALDLATNKPVLQAFILYNKAIVHAKLKQMHSSGQCLEEASKCDYKNEPFGRDLLRFMLEPLKEEESALSPAQILEQRIQQKQQEFQMLIDQEDE